MFLSLSSGMVAEASVQRAVASTGTSQDLYTAAAHHTDEWFREENFSSEHAVSA